MKLFRIAPHHPARSGDDSPAPTLMRYVWRMSGRHQIAVCAIAILVAALGTVPIELQRRLVDDAIGKNDMALLGVLAALYLGVVVVHGGLKYFLRLYEGWLSESAIRYNRRHLGRLYARNHPTDPHEANGRVVSVIGNEIEKLGGFVGDGLSQPIVNCGMLLFGIGYMISVEPVVGLIGVAALVPQIALVPVIQKKINALIERRVQILRDVSDDLSMLKPGEVEHPAGDGHSANSDSSESSESSENSDNRANSAITSIMTGFNVLFDNRFKTFMLKFGMKALINLLNALTPLCVLIIGGYLVIRGETSVGVIVAFISGFDRMSAPVRELLSYYRVAAQAAVQHRLIAQWMRARL